MRVVLAKGGLRGRISGASETLVTYADELMRAGHDVSVVLVYPPRRGDDYLRRLREAEVPVTSLAGVDFEHALHAGRSYSHLTRRVPAMGPSISGAGRRMLVSLAGRFRHRSEEFFRRSGADVVHVVGQDAGAGVLLAAAGAARRRVLFQELGAGEQPSVYPKLEAQLRWCTEVAVLSPRIAERYAARAAPGTCVSVLPIITGPPVGTAVLPQISGRAGTTFGFACSLDPLKGPLVMVDATARAAPDVPGLRVRVAGAGPEEARLLARVRALGLAGAVERPVVYAGPEGRTAFMRSVEVLVLPSATEGTPHVIVEAMAHGLPVIATPVGGIADMVTPELGILVPPGDPEALARAMRDLAHDPDRRARMGRAAVRRYEAIFSPAAVMPLLLRTYGRVAGDPRHASDRLAHAWATGAA